ncbi:hypothetical protein CY34DRAFT_19212 [Suillus luteus UH-Slu-Lm8-n1]|uniref:DUF6532 domain-containing protein n=1 Tax=Suillus luteus UH-Slu-Lm8-n1 TaxID=930992 RepID=A0A0D0AJS3_9AGAM|nr:hypothetical protein CY34DRAFT_19212 [Suillus luteus UH-Slu-Lm8-n1]
MSRKAKGRRATSPTPTPPVSKPKGRQKAGSTLQVPDEQYEEFLKFQAQKKKETESSRKEDVRRKVDALLEEESDMEQEVLIDKKRKRVTRTRSAAAEPDTEDVDIEDDANPSDILPPVGPVKMKTPAAALDESDVLEVTNQAQADSSDEEGDISNSTATTRVRRTNGLIQVKDESTDDTTDRQWRKRITKGDIKPLTTLASLKKDGCGPLVDHAHQLLRINVALENAFPGPSADVQDSFTWDCIKEAAKDPGSPLKPMLEKVGRDDVLKSRAIAYVWSGASQLRGELVRKARDIVIFQLQQMRPKEISDIANWLLTTKKDPFFCGELDLKAKTFNKNLPFRAPLLRQLLYSQFFQGPGSEGIAYMERFQKLPNNLMALLATAVNNIFSLSYLGVVLITEGLI